MGLLDSIFGGKSSAKPRIPAPELKLKLIRTLLKKRVIEDEAAQLLGYTPAMVDALSVEILMGMPEATLVTIVDAFAQLKIKGLSHIDALNTIERSRTQGVAETVPAGMTLEAYAGYRVSREHGERAISSSAHIFQSVELARTLYRC